MEVCEREVAIDHRWMVAKSVTMANQTQADLAGLASTGNGEGMAWFLNFTSCCSGRVCG